MENILLFFVLFCGPAFIAAFCKSLDHYARRIRPKKFGWWLAIVILSIFWGAVAAGVMLLIVGLIASGIAMGAW